MKRKESGVASAHNGGGDGDDNGAGLAKTVLFLARNAAGVTVIAVGVYVVFHIINSYSKPDPSDTTTITTTASVADDNTTTTASTASTTADANTTTASTANRPVATTKETTPVATASVNTAQVVGIVVSILVALGAVLLVFAKALKRVPDVTERHAHLSV
jgi:cytoskeletal protein RodZ